jgi:hypothetical protein
MQPDDDNRFGMIFTRTPLQQGCDHPPASACASCCGRRKSDLCSGLPESLVQFKVPGPRLHSVLQGWPACCTALLPLCIPCYSPPPRQTAPAPCSYWRLPPMRLELTMFMLSLSSTISESLPHCSKSPLFQRTRSRRHCRSSPD